MRMITVERREDGVAMVWLDHPEKPVNTLSPAVVEEFGDTVAPLLDDASVRGELERLRQEVEKVSRHTIELVA